MESCPRARRRKTLDRAFLKLFSRCLVFIVIFSSVCNASRPVVCNHQAVAGFWSTSFEGGRKCGAEGGGLLDSRLIQVRRGQHDSLS